MVFRTMRLPRMGEFKPWVGVADWATGVYGRVADRSQKPKTVEVEVIGAIPRTEQWDADEARVTLPEGCHYYVPQRGNKGKYMYCVFESGGQYYPIPLDRQANKITVDEIADKPVATASQVYHLQKKHTMHRRYQRRGGAMEKIQATLYVCLAGGLGFLLFIIFAEVTKDGMPAG